MYKCLDCGEVFDEPASVRETYGFTDGFGVTFYMCPYCNGNYEEAHQCQECDEWHTEDELYEGWCEKCLRETINYDTFFEYATDTKLFLNFMFETVWDSSEPEKASERLVAAIAEIYKRMKANDLLCNSHGFINLCRKYIMEDDGEYGRINYAEWLNEREVK